MPAERRRSRLTTALLSIGLLVTAGIGLGAPLALDPETACQALAAEGLASRGNYRVTNDSYRCASGRKPLTAGGAARHEIRFYAVGNATSVERVVVELRIRSREDIQRAHRILARYAGALTERLLHTALPTAINDAILSGNNGNWSVNDRNINLRRNTAGAALYELRLTIE